MNTKSQEGSYDVLLGAGVGVGVGVGVVMGGPKKTKHSSSLNWSSSE